MTKLEIIQLICISVILIGTVVLTIIKAIKNNWIGKLTDCIEVSIKEAEEKWPNGNGSEKLNFVLEKVKIKCNELGIPYLTIYKLVKTLIEKIVANYNVIAK